VASSAGILVVGGGGTACGIGANSPLVRNAAFTGNQLTGNDIGIALFNTDATCTKSASAPTRDTVCGNAIANSHGYPSADANITGFSSTVGYQADTVSVAAIAPEVYGNTYDNLPYSP
jgi:hypothetical protein